MQKHTKEERSAYFATLRDQWKASKVQADQDQDARAKWQAIRDNAPDGKMSYYGFFFCYQSMKAAGLDGLPYVDAKTFNGWKASGFIVKKGQRSLISGITWISPKTKEADGTVSEDDSYCYPKAYALFHRSQVMENV